VSIPQEPRNGGAPAELLDRLPCGRDIDDLVEQVADGHAHRLDDHEQGCTHCRAYLSEIQRLWAPVAALAAEHLEPPPELVGKIMQIVRELALEIWHVVVPGDRGTTRIAARVLATLATRAAARAPGVRVVLGRSSQPKAVAHTAEITHAHRQPGSAVGIAGQQATIDLAVVTNYGANIPDVADTIRRLVTDDLRTASLREVDVNIIVDDVAAPPHR